MATSPLGSFLLVMGISGLSYAIPPHPALFAFWIGVLLVLALLASPQQNFSQLVASGRRKRTVLFFVLMGPIFITAHRRDLSPETVQLSLFAASWGMLIASVALRVFSSWYPVDEDRSPRVFTPLPSDHFR